MAGLTAEQKQHYDEQGYVFLRGLFDPEELQPLIAEIEAKVDQVAHDYYAAGQLTSLHEEYGLKHRLRKMVEECDDVYQEIPGGQFCGPALFEILRHPKLVDIAEAIVGPEVHCEGRHRLRPKLPQYGLADFRWHEDTRYDVRRITYTQQQYGLGAHDPGQGDTFISRIAPAPTMPEPGFWIPLVDVDEENGCLHVMPGGHRHTVPYTEQWRPSQFMPQLDGLDDVAMPMQVGDALLIHQHMPHVSPPNRSDHVRWSEDIRYQDARLPIKSQREPGFLAKSKERPDGIVTAWDEYRRIREAAAAYQQATMEAAEAFRETTGMALF